VDGQKQQQQRLFGMESGYTSGEVADLARTSLRCIQWWDERGLISPSQLGHRRRFSEYQAMEVMVVAELRRKGIALQKLRPIFRSIRNAVKTAMDSAGERWYLLTDERRVFIESDTSRIVKLLEQSPSRFYVVSLSGLTGRLFKERVVA